MPVAQLRTAGRNAAEVWSLAWPTVVTMLSYTVMQFVDSIMVAQLGPLELAAQGNGGVWTWTATAFLVGILSLVNTFVSQALGAGETDSASRYAWAGIWFGLVSWIAILIPYGLLVLPWGFSQMGHEPRLMELELVYGQWLIVGGCFTLTAKAFSNFFFAVQRPKVVAVAAIAGNIVNLLLNYVLVFGEEGMPAYGLPGIRGVRALGVEGSAIATIFGVAVECLIPACVFFGGAMAEKYATRKHWRLDSGAIGDLLRVGWPAAIQFGNEMFCWSVFMTVLVGVFGTAHLAAGWAVLRYMHLSFMPTVAFSIATATLVGRSIGAGNPEQAVRYTRTAVWMSVLYMGAWGVMMLILREPMIRLFAESSGHDGAVADQVVAIGGTIMIAAAIFQAFDAVGIVYTGALRGAGDTLWPGVMTILCSWGLIVGVGWLLVKYRPDMASTGPWIGATAYIILLSLMMCWRFERGPWRTRRLVRHAGTAGTH